LFKAIVGLAKNTGTSLDTLYTKFTESEIWHFYYAALEVSGVEVQGDVERILDAGYSEEDIKKLSEVTAGLMA